MRTSIKAGMLCLFATTIIATANAQNAKTFYVCSGTSFTMIPDDTTHTTYEWREVGGTGILATSKTLPVTAPSLGGTTYTTKRYTLTIQDGTGCSSANDTFTVHVLPPVTVNITGNSGPYCSNNSQSVTLTANVGSLTLPAGAADSLRDRHKPYSVLPGLALPARILSL